MTLSFTMPIKTVSEANRASHEHWSVRQRRAKTQRMAGFLHATSEISRSGWAQLIRRDPTCAVTLARIAPRDLDDDNHVGSLKHVRDSIADALGVKDNDKRVHWKYGPQERGKPREYAVRVTIESTGAAP
jgi:hypothetical protein